MRKLNCKVGDLAIVISAELPANLGQIVEILGDPRPGTPLPGPGHVWHVRSIGGRRSLTYFFRDTGRTERLAEGPVPDIRLRPLNGLPDDDGKTERVFRQEWARL
jgi:hypothetical protein